MLKVQELMTPEPEVLEPEMTLRDAIERLADLGVSGAPVVSTERLVGVLSTHDILEVTSATPGVPALRDLAEWGEWGTSEAIDSAAEEPPPGYFRDLWADSGADVRERIEVTDSPEWDFLSEHIVGEVMTRKVLSVGPEDDVTRAARIMMDHGVRRLLVVEDDVLQGIISTTDFVRAVATGKLGPVR